MKECLKQQDVVMKIMANQDLHALLKNNEVLNKIST